MGIRLQQKVCLVRIIGEQIPELTTSPPSCLCPPIPARRARSIAGSTSGRRTRHRDALPSGDLKSISRQPSPTRSRRHTQPLTKLLFAVCRRDQERLAHDLERYGVTVVGLCNGYAVFVDLAAVTSKRNALHSELCDLLAYCLRVIATFNISFLS